VRQHRPEGLVQVGVAEAVVGLDEAVGDDPEAVAQEGGGQLATEEHGRSQQRDGQDGRAAEGVAQSPGERGVGGRVGPGEVHRPADLGRQQVDDYKKLEYTVHSATGIEIQTIEVEPMPILNPGEAHLSFKANLKRPIKTIRTVLNIVRAVSGINLPIKCYKVSGVEVGSCDYKDLCLVLKTMLPSFNPTDCPKPMAHYGIDCNCPFNIPTGQLNIIRERLELPDAQGSIAAFMASGDFVIRLDTHDTVGPYASLTIKFTVKPKHSG